ncbi:MAG TPA: dTDP-4-dehydrorhamnose reductase [Thermoleophilaceae bacterium]
MTVERALVTGGGGQLASDLEEQLERRGVGVRAPARAALDVTDDDALARAFDEERPQLVVNCAAFHNLDVCEVEEDRSFEVNARAVKRMAQRCAETGARLVHLSTNYVFDGRRPEPYREDETPSPRSIYAISKLAGEHCALAYAPDSLVVRGAGLYGLHGSASKGGNFVTRMVARAREQGALKMVADQRLSPTFTADLAAAVLEAVDAGASGVLHLTAGGECSWLEFTEAIMEIAGIDVPIEAVETTIPPGGVDRPLNGVLARPAADAAGLAPLRHWREALEDYMRRAGLAAAAA